MYKRSVRSINQFNFNRVSHSVFTFMQVSHTEEQLVSELLSKSVEISQLRRRTVSRSVNTRGM